MTNLLRNSAQAVANIKHTLDFALPDISSDILGDLEKKIKVPSRWTFGRSMCKLDWAAMQHTRTLNARAEPVVRYINPDASPQGREIYVMKLWEDRNRNYKEAVAEIAPICTLSHGHGSTADKGMTIHHVAFLLGGPTIPGMRKWGREVFGYIGDLGDIKSRTVPDMCEIYVRGESPERWAACKGTAFMPNAMPIAGPSHLCDWVLFQTLVRHFDTWAACVSIFLNTYLSKYKTNTSF